jgi:adenosylcobinamide kinase/adenosylcobinamide-phosphate guanylyltransferase
MTTTLLIGGARSGKSALALRIAEARNDPVTFIASGEPRDDEMRARILQHQAQRHPDWTTVEEPVEIAKAIAETDPGHLVILDCLTLWASNLLDRGFSVEESEARAHEAAGVAVARGHPVIVITNEVGSGIVPANPLARAYRDLLGSINAIFARDAARVFFVTAGRALPLLRPEEVLRDDIDG